MRNTIQAMHFLLHYEKVIYITRVAEVYFSLRLA